MKFRRNSVSFSCSDVYQCLRDAYETTLGINDKIAGILISIEQGYGVTFEELALRIKDLVPDLYRLVRDILDVVKLLNGVGIDV